MAGFRSALAIPLGIGKPGQSLGFVGLPWFRGGVPSTVTGGTGVDFGWGSSVQRVSDTRWKGVKEARELAAAAFREVEKAKPAQRKQAAQEAVEAVAKVAKAIQPPITQLPQLETSFDAVLQDLDTLQAYLAGLMEGERVKAAQAREAAERWAMIERELIQQAMLEEELMIVLALAL